MSRKKVLMSASAAAVVASAFVATEDVSAATQKVSAGDSLFKIAQENNVSVSDLRKWNNLKHDLIFPNQVLQVMKPVDKGSNKNEASEVSNSNSEADTHIVISGDTLSEIAFANNVSVKNLMESNNLNSTLIFPGNTLSIPGKNKESDEGIHTVVAGDTLSHLALKHGITAQTIADLNNMKLGDIIHVGDKLILEEGQSDESANQKSEAKPKVNTSSKTETKVEEKPKASTQVESKPKAEVKPEVEAEPTKEPVAEKVSEPTEETVVEEEPVAEKETEAKEEPVVEEKTEAKEEPVVEEKTEAKEEPVVEEVTETKEEPVVEEVTETKEEPVVEEVTETKEEPVVEEVTKPKEEPVVEKETEVKEDPKPEAKPDTNSSTYVVKSGDSLSKIASAYGTTVQKIATISGIETNSTLNVGDKLKVKGTPVETSKPETKPEPEVKPEVKPKPEAKPKPEPKPEVKPDANASTYVVKSGDTLAAIAGAHGTTAQKIASNSGISTSTVLHIGDKLSVNGKALDNSNSNSSPVVNTGNSNSKPDSKPAPTPKPQTNTGYSANQLMSSADSVMGTKYVWGGTTQSGGFDCSGFIHWAYNDAGKEMPRTSTDGYHSRSYEISKSELQVGDLVFFSGTYRPGISHMGIYAGNNQFKHAATSTGVATTSLDNPYWSKHFDSFKRFY